MTQRFEEAYNALYNAFMNDTLAKEINGERSKG